MPGDQRRLQSVDKPGDVFEMRCVDPIGRTERQ
jgi:hypothetical protein